MFAIITIKILISELRSYTGNIQRESVSHLNFTNSSFWTDICTPPYHCI